MQQIKCPECGEKIFNTTKRCKCGWRVEKNNENTNSTKRDDRCAYQNLNKRCPLRGTVSPSRSGLGIWYCLGHWQCLDDPSRGEIVLRDAEKNYQTTMQNHIDWRRQLFLEDYQIQKTKGVR